MDVGATRPRLLLLPVIRLYGVTRTLLSMDTQVMILDLSRSNFARVWPLHEFMATPCHRASCCERCESDEGEEGEGKFWKNCPFDAIGFVENRAGYRAAVYSLLQHTALQL